MPSEVEFQKGFTLIEILVSLLLSSLAILSLYMLQIKDRQLFIDLLIQNEAQMQVQNSRELILADPVNASTQIPTILSLTYINPDFKMEITLEGPSQFLLHTHWQSPLDKKENSFSLSLHS
jgi:prepilin-type N-terminal cleavage/methylation domain-containing protein